MVPRRGGRAAGLPRRHQRAETHPGVARPRAPSAGRDAVAARVPGREGGAVNILEAIADPKLFGPHFRGSSWSAWYAFLAARFGLGWSDAEAEGFRACTGRAAAPSGGCQGVGRGARR